MSNRAFVPSPQQATFFDWIVNGKGNAIIQAVAGSGKTTTLLHGMAKMTGTVLYIVFNKANELEAKAKLARMGVKAIAKTFHSLGYSALRRVCPKAKMDNKKTFLVMDSLKIPQEFHAFVRKAVTLAKNRALGCDGFGSLNDRSQWAAIVDRFDLVQELDDTTPLDVAIDYAIQTLIKSNDMLRELVDFDDMIYGCIYLGVTLFQNDWVVVDEGQDTNASRRALIRMALNRKGRAAFVGDVAQAIYGFTGADAESFEILKKEFNCQELPLTVTYRCPKAVVDVAKGYVPAIEAHESAIDGVVTSVDVESFDPSTLSKDDAILCRKTKPLIELAYSLIKKNIPCHVEGRDIGANLKTLLCKWKSVRSVDAYLSRLEKWEDSQVARAMAKGNDMAADSVRDRCDTIRCLCEGCATVDDVKAKIDRMFSDTEEGQKPRNLTLSTVHKSKGREFPHVAILKFKEFMPSPMAKQEWQKVQENNLIYVGVTRAIERLTLVG